MSALAPMSTAAVGEFSKKILAPLASQRARIAFCWLPPLRESIEVSILDILIASLVAISLPSVRSLLRRMNRVTGSVTNRWRFGSEMFSRTLAPDSRLSACRLCGTSAMPAFCASRGERSVSTFPCALNWPPDAVDRAKSRSRASSAPLPGRPAKPRISPDRHSQLGPPTPPAGQAVGNDDGLAEVLPPAFRIVDPRLVAADDGFDDGLARHLLARPGPGPAPVPGHRDSIGEYEHL